MADPLQKEMPEAVASVSYSLLSPNGYPLTFTLRQPTSERLLELMTAVELILIGQGYQPDIKRYGRPAKKPVETVPGRQCPTCGNPLVYFEAKGQKHIKCSTQNYDWKTKQSTGCPYVEWADRQVEATLSPTAVPLTTPAFEPATQAQVELIKVKVPHLYKEGLSKREAGLIITDNLNK